MYLPSQSPYVTKDNDESVGVVVLQSMLAQKRGPPIHKASIKPSLAKPGKLQAKQSYDLSRGRPLPAAPPLAKHLIEQTRPICLKLSP